MNSDRNYHPNRGRTRVAVTPVAALFVALCACCSFTWAQDVSFPIADKHADQHHLFRYLPEKIDHVGKVFLAGDFNGWSTDATPMIRNGNGFEVDMTLTEGVHYYKFVADGKWLNDPASQTDLEVSDGNGGNNSAVMIGLGSRKFAAPSPEKINAAAIAFDPSDTRDLNVASTRLLRVSITAQTDDVNNVELLLQSGDAWSSFPLLKTETQKGIDCYGTLVTTPAGASSPLHYMFKLSKPQAAVYVADSRAYINQADAAQHAYSVTMQPAFDTPDWAKHAIWYQIFPERFRNGDTSNDPPNTKKWTSKWFEELPGESGDFYSHVYDRRYGGDIQGIRQELPYLRSLGITAIYLNPIFEAESLHKYDTSDYRHVDEYFGVAGDIEKLKGETEDPKTWQWTASDRIFLDFIAEAHKQGFKIVIDGVFNHVGRKFWAFQDVIKNGKASRYADWFDITDWTPTSDTPFHYHAWDKDNGSLPALKKDPQLGIAHGPREHIFGITRRWLAPDGDPSKGVDGFRLDAPEGIAHPFWAEWRQLVKSTKPDAYITGEIWSWAQSYLQGDQYDAVMNYQFAMASQDFFVNVKKAASPHDLNNRANALIFNYPFQVALVNQNLFDSHDTDRVASMFVNPDLAYDAADRIQDNGPHYSPAKPNAQQRQRMLQEVAWQMSFVGAPMIYYGDEAGMWSPDDPSDRQPMIWKDLEPYADPQVKFDQDKFDWYQRMIAIRQHLPAMQTGFYHPVLMDDARGIFVFSRDLGSSHVYVVLNRSAHPQKVQFTPVASQSGFVNWIDSAQASVTPSTEGRPGISMVHNSKPMGTDQGKLMVPLGAYETAIISPAP